MFDVRPTENLEDFQSAFLAIGQYFGAEPTPERAEKFSQSLPFERMHAAREDGAIVGGAGVFPFEMAIPGGIVRCAGVTVVGVYPTHRRRGVLRAMMRAQIDDIHAARRADRGAVGVRGDDLRTLRLRDGVVHRRDLARTRALRVRAPVRAARTPAPARAERGARAAPADLGARAPADARDVQARAPVVGEPGRPRPARAPRGRWAEALRAARARRRAAGVRDLPAQHEVGRGLDGGAARRDRGDRSDAARDRGDLALPARHRLAGVDQRRPAADRPPALLSAREAAPDEVPR